MCVNNSIKLVKAQFTALLHTRAIQRHMRTYLYSAPEPLHYRLSLNETYENEYDGNYQEHVDKTSDRVRGYEAKCPEHEEYNRNGV